MKSTLELLSIKEKQALAHLYQTDAYRALQKVHELEKHGLGQDALVAPDLNQLHHLRGQVFQSKYLIRLIKECYKQTEKG